MKSITTFLLAFICAYLYSVPPLWASAAVTVMRLPHNAIQPQAASDSDGAVHLLYFSGDPRHGNLYYSKRGPEKSNSFSQPIRVNSVDGSAIALGTIRGAQLALGKNGRIFVVWNGSDRDPGSAGHGTVLFSRLNSKKSAFEPERNLLHEDVQMDGGCTIAADSLDHLYVFWHASAPGKDEEQGRIYMSSSNDAGSTFSRERVIDQPSHGACGCCSMKASTTEDGKLFVLYRAAENNTARDTVLLSSKDRGRSFASTVLQNWQSNQCPMTMFALASSERRMFGAWENEGRINFAALTDPVSASFIPTSAGNSKYPSIAVNAAGDILCSWTDGAGWNKGGEACWQIYDSKTEQYTAPSKQLGVNAWSFTAAVPQHDGSFLLIF